jgi:hypothetical protein
VASTEIDFLNVANSEARVSATNHFDLQSAQLLIHHIQALQIFVINKHPHFHI